jgi:hypothetical protein
MKFVDTNYILDELYPLVKSKLDNKTIERKTIQCIGKFFNKRCSQINDIAPYSNIYYNQADLDDFLTNINISEDEVINVLKKCWFWDKEIRPKCTKEPYVEIVMCAIRYYLTKRDRKNAELFAIYLLFSGKFYASIYSSLWKFPVNPAIMDYVINNSLSDKYDLKKEGTLFKAIRKLAITYITKYEKELIEKKHSDNDFKNNIQQLRDREKSFLGNIFTSYMDAAESKSYMNYETDNLDPEEFRITDNDAAKASRITESAIGILTSQSVSTKYCNIAKNERVKAEQIKTILESIILINKENIPQMRRVINIMVCSFMSRYPGKSINSIEFYKYAITPKPNTKDELIIEMESIIMNWLQQDELFRARSNTKITVSCYKRALYSYFAQVIIKASERL